MFDFCNLYEFNTKNFILKHFLKNILIFLILFQIFFETNVYSQYTVEWACGFGGDKSDEAKCVIETSDGNIIMCGEVNQEQKHIWILKTDYSGVEIWGKTEENNFSSSAISIINTSDNNFIVVGNITRRKSDKYSDALIMKIDQKGRIIWRKTFGGIFNDSFNDVVQTDDGGFFCVGYSEDETEQEKMFWTVKLDKEGKFEFENAFGETSDDAANALIKTSDGNFIAAGHGIFAGKKVMRIIKLSSSCEYIWDTQLEMKDLSEISDLLEMPDGNILLVGTMTNFDFKDFDVLFLKYSTSGDSLSLRKIGYAGLWEEATSVCKTYDGDFLISGFRKGAGEMNSDFLVYKIDENLNIIWEDVLKKRSLDYSYSIAELSDNGFIIVGTTYMFERGIDFAAVKYKDLNKTKVAIINPSAEITAVEENQINLEICISGFDVPEKSDIVVNGFLSIANAYNNITVSTKTCKYPVYANIKLEDGYNEIEIFIKDKRGFYAYDKKIIYSVPSQSVNW